MSFPSIHKQGYLFILVCFFLSCIGFALSFGLGLLCMFATVLCVYFFRDPVRVVPRDDRLVVSAGDGVVVDISEVTSPLGDESLMTCVGVFLSILDVHVNRIPLSGTVTVRDYCPGRFHSANLPKCSAENERMRVAIKSHFGNYEIVVEQVAGIFARRIVCNIEKDQDVKVGRKLGIIRFGSRVNVYVPKGIPIKVSVGQTVIGGETVIANLEENGVEGVHEQMFDLV